MNIIENIYYRRRLGNAVKEALDSLPSAVCYFTPDGSVKLCNRAMYNVYRLLAQQQLQSFDELKAAMEECTANTGVIKEGNCFIFPDGHVRQYSAREVTTKENRTYTEAVFSDVTEIYEKRRNLQHQSREMKKMYDELRVLSGQLQEITREQEILNMKSLLHDQMNMGITAIRQSLRQNSTSESNAAAIAQFRRAIQILQEESTCPQDEMSEFIRDAKVSGVEVVIQGEMPKAELMPELLVPVLREACVNAARHADAFKLTILSQIDNGFVTLSVTNDGKSPEQEIVPRGGLKDLGIRIRRAGGTMQILSLPEFMLTVSLPIGKSVRGTLFNENADNGNFSFNLTEERRCSHDKGTCG